MDQRTVSLILPLPPSSNRYWRTVISGNRALTFVSDEAKQYKRFVKDIAGLDTPIYSEISVTVKIFRPQRSGDLDNRLKVLFDALQGVVYANDSQIVEIHAFRFEDRPRPRVEVEVRALGLC
jgi:crossover junction endodeoxyribonuclease RusA